jgi:hypothetical protein
MTMIQVAAMGAIWSSITHLASGNKKLPRKRVWRSIPFWKSSSGAKAGAGVGGVVVVGVSSAGACD